MKPILQALLVADHVYEDKNTSKKVVAGIFHHLWYRKAEDAIQDNKEDGTRKIQVSPGGLKAGSPFCYISMTELRNKPSFSLRYVKLSDEKVFFHTDFTVDCNNPLEIVEIVLPLPTLPADSPGTYALELLWNKDEPLGSHRIIAEEMQEPGEEKK